jgi:hypothetical protein
MHNKMLYLLKTAISNVSNNEMKMEKSDKGGAQAQSRHIPEVSHPMLLQEPFLYLLSPNQAFETKLLRSKKQVILINIQEMNDNKISAFLTSNPI